MVTATVTAIAKTDGTELGGVDASKQPLLARRIAFVAAATEAGRSNVGAQSALAGGLPGYIVHVVKAKAPAAVPVTAAVTAALTAPAAPAPMPASSTASSPALADPFLAYLPTAAESLYPEPREGGYESLLTWQSRANPGPGLSNMGNTCFLNSVLQCLTYSPLFAQLCLARPAALAASDAAPPPSLFPGARSEPLVAIAQRARRASKGSRFCALATVAAHMQAIHVGMPSSSQHPALLDGALLARLGAKAPPTAAAAADAEAGERAVAGSGRRTRFSVDPEVFVRSLGKLSEDMQFGSQHDAHEFLRVLVDNMQRSCALAAGLPETSTARALETSAVMRLFGGYTESRVSCGRCSASSCSFEPFMDMSLDIASAGVARVEDALASYLGAETLDKDNKWDCPRCGRVDSAVKQLSVRRCPPVLVLHLKRFGFGTRSRKLNKAVKFDAELDMAPFSSPADGDGEARYALTGLVVHCGVSLNLGHYVCYVKASNGVWYEMDDDVVRQVPLQRVLEQPAYLLFYSKLVAPATVSPSASAAAPDGPTPPLGALAAFASRYASGAGGSSGGSGPSKEAAIAARSALFGDFLDELPGAAASPPALNRDHEGDKEQDSEERASENDAEAQESEASSTDGAARRRAAVARTKPWNLWFPAKALKTPSALRQLYLERDLARRRLSADRFMRQLVAVKKAEEVRAAKAEQVRAAKAELERAAAKDASAPASGRAAAPPPNPACASRSPPAREAAPTSEAKREAALASEAAREAAERARESEAQSLAAEKARRRQVLERVAAGDESVHLNRRSGPRASGAGKEAWASRLKAGKGSGAKPGGTPARANGSKRVYDAWDEALDRGKLKKVKLAPEGAEPASADAAAANLFQKVQDRANVRERQRKQHR